MKRLEDLGSTIKKARWQKMITQTDLAKQLGFTGSHLCEIEKGKKYPSVEVLWKIEQILGPIWRSPDEA